MSSNYYSSDDLPPLRSRRFWKRLGLLIGVPLVAALVLFLILWNTFFRYVPPGKMLVIVSKHGDPLPAGQILADEGQQGIQRKVLGEGCSSRPLAPHRAAERWEPHPRIRSWK